MEETAGNVPLSGDSAAAACKKRAAEESLSGGKGKDKIAKVEKEKKRALRRM